MSNKMMCDKQSQHNETGGYKLKKLNQLSILATIPCCEIMVTNVSNLTKKAFYGEPKKKKTKKINCRRSMNRRRSSMVTFSPPLMNQNSTLPQRGEEVQALGISLVIFSRPHSGAASLKPIVMAF